ncbi:pyridine nucleotide-disulfide oxidoreductase/dicluster-binding protein [Hominibacterium faecale]|uniref:pyridine nucleotide-disulfide oxidoreductase/dicluster-binding protein n=1 Tax=Hominibacterium faecale TaxID=2839743 RepID=UPI0022B29E80|nr:pyridine nucleotide-disulfide oxidoreductase/dicluster-binding protein [Hominibacterium faecale]
MQNYYKQFETCRERDIPACADACPFKLDILTVQDKIATGRFNAAYKSIRDQVVFPGIVSEICPAYCENVCIRKSIDAPVQVRLMEKSVVASATRKTSNKYNLPAKKKSVAVIGAGLSGMGFAFRMASKKYPVTVFEKEDRIGGHLKELMEESVYMAEFDLQFANENYELRLNTQIDDIHKLCKNGGSESPDASGGGETFDVIYVATGKGGNTFGLPMPNQKTETGGPGGYMTVGDTAVFIGGEVCGKDLMHALADGINIASSAEGFLKAKKLDYPKQAQPTGCVPDQDKLTDTPAVIPKDGKILDQEECIAEAKRCIRCQCDACTAQCDLVAYFDKMPVKMRDEIFLSCKPAGSLVHKSPARKYVAACTRCDLMTEGCPEHIDLCGMVKYARHKMHDADKVPAAYRQYFIRDMAFANGEYAALKKTMGTEGNYAFFPGCNLGALEPEYVLRPYKWLLSKQPDTSILLRCCSVPADWDGNSRQHGEEIEALRRDWMDLGKPTLIMACMSCQKHIRQYLPEIETVSLYEILEQWGFEPDEAAKEDKGTSYAIFDPCSARNEENVQSAVRTLISASGISAGELPKGDQHGCCGFGGMGSVAAPEFAEYVARQRMELSEAPYIVYCSNCKDIFCDRGKKTVHILDILFGIDPDGVRSQPDLTRRRMNRVALKKRLLEEIWKEEPKMESYENEYPLIMEDEVREKVNKQKILEEDICAVIDNAETTGRRTFDPNTGHYKAYKEIGHITCWVEYTPLEQGYEVHNLYTHRMKIELEAVWNGRKTETDL